MSELDDLLRRFDGRPIPNCPGRFVLRGIDPTRGPSAVIPEGHVTAHAPTTTRDRVVVTRVGQSVDWGLISYARSDGTWVHTANTAEGFARKLADLGLM